MISIREQRLWTALAVTGLSFFIFGSALPTLRFGLALQSDGADATRSRLQAAAEKPAEALARRAMLFVTPPDESASARVKTLQDLIALTPLSSGAWLDLAIARQRAGQPMERVASALAMSSLTGPNEARFMAGRAGFGLPMWDKLPPDVRRGLIGDLISGWSEVDDAERQELNAILTVSPDQTRAEILAALLLAGKPGEPVIAALDLALAKSPEPVDDAGVVPDVEKQNER